jgi:SSS family solute:Na+ symporter
MSWQGTQGFYSSARNPHEQRMGNIIGFWRSLPQSVLMTLLPLAALAIMRLPEYSARAALVQHTLAAIPNQYVRSQMTVPIVMAHLLPNGIKGLLATIFLFYSFTCHDTYMHSWGAIFVQDVVMPLRQRTMSVNQHILWLRLSILFVAVFAFFFSLFYVPSDHIYFFFAITGTIWLGGSGAVIIGGLYSRWGTTAGAYAALIFGATVGLAGLTVPPWYEHHYHHTFPVNGQWQFLLGMVCSLLAYTVVSAATGGFGYAFNLRKMLRRDRPAAEAPPPVSASLMRARWMEVIGITREFSLGDRLLAFAMIGWNLASFTVFLVFSAINLVHPVADAVWAIYWRTFLTVLATLSVPAVIWFTIGGVIDIRALFRTLNTAERDQSDDGRVLHDEAPPPAEQADDTQEALVGGEPR